MTTISINGRPVPVEDCIWLERRPCGCIVAVVEATHPYPPLMTAGDVLGYLHPTPTGWVIARNARLTAVPVTRAQYEATYSDRWRCDTHSRPTA